MLGLPSLPLLDDQQLARAQFMSRRRRKTSFLVVHCDHSKPSVRKPIENLRWQGRALGLLDIGYHGIIDRDGCLHLIRSMDLQGSHTPGFNHESVGVCLIGGRDDDGRHVANFTFAQLSTLVSITASFQAYYPQARAVGHSEIQQVRKVGAASGKRVHAGSGRHCPIVDMEEVRREAEAVPLTEVVHFGRYIRDNKEE